MFRVFSSNSFTNKPASEVIERTFASHWCSDRRMGAFRYACFGASSGCEHLFLESSWIALCHDSEIQPPSAVFGSRRQTTWRALAQSWLIMSACLHGFTMFVEWGWLMPIEKIQRFITTGPLLWPQQLMAVNQWCTTHGTCFIKWCFHLKDFHVSVLTLPMLGWLCVLKARPQRQRHFTLRRSRPRGCRCVSSSACAVTCCCYQNL